MSLEDVESQVSRSRWRDVIEALRGADVNLKSVVAESVDTDQMSITHFINLTTKTTEPSSPSADDIYRSDGTWGVDEGLNRYTGSEWRLIAPEKMVYEVGMATWGDGLSNEEIHRINLESGEQLELDRVELRLKGGGSNSNLNIDVYDVDTSSVIDSANAGSTSLEGGRSSEGATVIVRISNSTGADQTSSAIVRGKII